MKNFLSSLRFRLILLVLLATLPAFWLVVSDAARAREDARAQAVEQTLNLVRITAAEQQTLISSTQSLLVGMAELPQLRPEQAAECSALLATILPLHPIYVNLGVADAQGDIYCSAVPQTTPVNASDRAWFIRVMQTRDFSAGDYQIGRITDKPAIVAAYPVFENDAVVAVVFAELNLDWMEDIVQPAHLPEGSAYMVVDQHGVILARWPGGEEWMGKPAPEDSIVTRALETNAEGTGEAPGIDDTPRLYAYTPLLVTETPIGYVIIGLPTAQLYAPAEEQLRSHLLILGGAALLTLLIAWLGNEIIAIRLLHHLLAATRRLNEGDLTARTGIKGGVSELVQLSRAFDEMAASLEKHLRMFNGLFESAPDALLVVDREGCIMNANAQAETVFGCSRADLLGQPVEVLLPPALAERHQQHCADYFANPRTRPMGQGMELQARRQDGSEFPVEISLSWIETDDGPLALATVRDITERKQAEEEIRRSHQQYEELVNSVDGIVWEADARTFQFSFVSQQAERILGYPVERWITEPTFWKDHIYPEDREWVVSFCINATAEKRPHQFEYRMIAADGRVVWLRDIVVVVLKDGQPDMLRGIMVDFTERKQAEVKNVRQLQTLTALYATAQKLSESLDLNAVAAAIARTCVEVFGVRMAWLCRAEEDGRVSIISQFPADHPYPQQITVRWDETPEGQGPTGHAIRSGLPQVSPDFLSDPDFAPWRPLAEKHGLRSSVALPLISRGHAFGALNLYSDRPGFFTPELLETFQALANQAATALENTRLYADALRRLKTVQALRNIDLAITSSLDPRVTMRVLLDEVTSQLAVDAASMLLLNQYSQTLEFVAGRGFHTKAIERSRLRLGEGHAGRAALDGRVVTITDLRAEPDRFLRTDLLKGEEFISYSVAPLISKGKVLGVLETFHRSPLASNREWEELLEALAGQAAIAIDNARLFAGLEKSNTELRLAYDATIEGWSRAMDLRDKETEGHTLRVTELTVKLARMMGMDEAQLVHVWRGGLLHDMGKLGIPDSILLKPDKLTDEEWEIMRRHPQFAYEMLAPIEYLRPALDIPYCHHEKWDGTGYPRGLKGEQIPLVARIFAVVDVYDALTSDRPYRPAWPKEKVLEHIRAGAGTHFDPQVVEAFFQLLADS